MSKPDAIETRLAQIEDAVRSLAVLVSGHRPVPFDEHEALAAICQQRWPEIGRTSSLPRPRRTPHEQ